MRTLKTMVVFFKGWGMYLRGGVGVEGFGAGDLWF